MKLTTWAGSSAAVYGERAEPSIIGWRGELREDARYDLRPLEIERSDSLLLRGGGFRRRCEQIPAARRLRENALQVLRQQVASVDQALRRVTYFIEIDGPA